MEHPILSPRTGIVQSVDVAVGAPVVAGQLLLTIE
jgi:biotin carboxyl carrier protein